MKFLGLFLYLETLLCMKLDSRETGVKSRVGD